MAFRRRFNPRFSRRGFRAPRRTGVTAGVEKRLSRKLDKRHHWQVLADTMCQPLFLACKGCCPEPEEPETLVRGCTYDEEGNLLSSTPEPSPVVLIAPAYQDVSAADTTMLPYEPDTLTVVAMRGYVELCPAFCHPVNVFTSCDNDPTHCPQFQQFSRQFRNYHLRAGLSKDRWELDPLSNQYSTINRYPLNPVEWSDGRFMRTWEKVKAAVQLTHQIHNMSASTPLGCCGNVSAAGAGAPANTLSNGSGTVNIPAISTDCEPCLPGEETDGGLYTALTDFPCIRLSLNSRRRLTFKENEGLTLWFDWTSFDAITLPNIDWRPNIGWQARIFAKALLETA